MRVLCQIWPSAPTGFSRFRNVAAASGDSGAEATRPSCRQTRSSMGKKVSPSSRPPVWERMFLLLRWNGVTRWVRIKKFINRSGEAVELPGSLPWLASPGVEESCRNSPRAGAGWVMEPKGDGGAWGEPWKAFPWKLSNVEGFEAKVSNGRFAPLGRVSNWVLFRETHGNLL